MKLILVCSQISLSKVRFLIFDEADRMLDMGFLPAMRKLVGNPDMPSKADRQALMFSATFPEDVQRLAQEILSDSYLFLVVGRVGGANLDIEQTVYNVDNHGKREKLLGILNESAQYFTVFITFNIIMSVCQCGYFLDAPTTVFLDSWASGLFWQ